VAFADSEGAWAFYYDRAGGEPTGTFGARARPRSSGCMNSAKCRTWVEQSLRVQHARDQALLRRQLRHAEVGRHILSGTGAVVFHSA
jgi:hypothetical protein